MNVWSASSMRRFSQSAACGGEEKVVVVPPMGDSITEGAIEAWQKNVGDFVNTDEVVLIIETDKVSQEIRAEFSGTLLEAFVEEGDQVAVGDKLYRIEAGQAPEGAAAPAATSTSTSTSSEAPKKQQQQQEEEAPKKQAEAPKKEAAAPQQKAAAAGATSSDGTVTVGRVERRVKMNRMRKMIASRLKESQNTNAMLTTFNEIDMTNIMALRNKYKEEFAERHGVKLGFMSAFVRASAYALQEQPAVNAVIDGDDIVYRDFVDVSVAVATPKGLVVPVLRNTETMSFADIEKTIGELGKKARDGQITMEDMTGGTFTISNGGVFGSLMGTPIINPPQSAILGMHATNLLPRVVDGQIVARPIMYVALTYDHRLIDGREAVTFLRKVKLLVEDPQRMLLE